MVDMIMPKKRLIEVTVEQALYRYSPSPSLEPRSRDCSVEEGV